ncbi:tRNA pseudouridine(38-40) synthase TruA [Cerasicoccus arenae]|uniref:tRNA pseudouridine synthase A n=1 Tax=Cerasicoccus arenae TaxID=424488 RepID=A0A8J3GCK4_9BACT|nr:tRNA pseudouridine(38-40) synthase TruA [Cerasicoccus arenae]MBK1859496.1 tRNA pseudouridine(38-40) synthase TruA [Cerasicoccus arenae]GHB94978.1 tRNA pseudouridine synthase A [Cerasicoccus arenae]
MIWKCTCAYDGTGLSGWQSQPNGNTVQDFIEARLGVILEQPTRIHGSGRTDAGVHAKAQIFHFESGWPHGEEKLLRAFRAGLPAGIQVYHVALETDDFHARFSATGKRYSYRFFEGWARPWDARYCWELGRRQLDQFAMNEAAAHLIGEHDFSAFSANRADGSEDNPIKDMRMLEVRRRGANLTLVTEASGYLYKMVRSLAGVLVEVGLGKLTPEQVHEILILRQRTNHVATAPAKGLWLERVYYGDHANPNNE